MIIFPRGEVRTWSDLTPGALFGVSIRGETHLGVKIQDSGDEYHCAVLTGLPPHYVREIVVQNSLLYFFPNSKIVPVGRRLQFSADGPRPQPGSLLQNSKATLSPSTGGSNHVRVRSSGWKGSRGGPPLCSHSGVEDCPSGARRTRSHFRMAR